MLLSRRIFMHFAKGKSKIDYNTSLVDDSNIIVDHMAWQQTGLFPRVSNYFKSKTAMSELIRNSKGKLNQKLIEQTMLSNYHKINSCYNERNHREIFNYVGNDLETAFKLAVKEKSKDEQLDLGWGLIDNPNKIQILMVRIYDRKLSQFRSLEKWFQLTCKFSNEQGQESLSVAERHENAKNFKFVKFNI